MSSTDYAIDVRGLTKTFGDFTAVNAIDLQVPAGEVFGFIGSNGAGKTTSIRMLCGVLPPTAGEGRVAGCDVRTNPEGIKENIGYMSQEFSLYEDLTAAENIDFYSGIYRVPADHKTDRKQWVLDLSNLADRPDTTVGDLPLGTRQRLALGCAMLHEPELLFLDEPTSGVDPATSRRFWETIHRMTGEDTTAFVTTHYMNEAEYCDRLSLLHAGELLHTGTPDELRSEARSAQAVALRVDRPGDARSRVESRPDVIRADQSDDTLSLLLADPAALEELTDDLRDHGVTVHAVDRMDPSLDDVFLDAIHRYERANAGEEPS